LAKLFQNFGISGGGGVEPPKHPPGYARGSEVDEYRSQPPILFFWDTFYFKLFSRLHLGLLPKPCIYLFYPMHATWAVHLIHLNLIILLEVENDEAHHHVFFSRILFLLIYQVQIFSSALFLWIHSGCVLPFLSFISHSCNPSNNFKTKDLQGGTRDFVANCSQYFY
jgi:hypothetical protein